MNEYNVAYKTAYYSSMKNELPYPVTWMKLENTMENVRATKNRQCVVHFTLYEMSRLKISRDKNISLHICFLMILEV